MMARIAEVRALLTRRRFGNWLRSKKVGSIVGVRGNPWHCPIARYLNEKLKNADISVSSTHLGLNGIERATVEWAGIFVAAIDNGDDTSITRKRALALLADLPKES